MLKRVVLGLLFCSLWLIASDASENKLKQATDDASAAIQYSPCMTLEAYKELFARIASSPEDIKRHIASFYDPYFFKPWKAYSPVRAAFHVEFMPGGRSIVCVGHKKILEKVITIQDICTDGSRSYTDQLTECEGYALYADPKRPYQLKSRCFSSSNGSMSNTRVIEMHQPPSKTYLNIKLEHAFFSERDELPYALALNADRTIFAVGTSKKLYLYKRDQLHLHELLEQNRHTKAELVVKKP